MNLRERRAQRQQLVADIRECLRDNPDATADDIANALHPVYGAMDWAAFLKLVMELLPIILALFKKP